MEDGMKAGLSISFDRQVYVSGCPSDVGGELAEPIARRIRNSTDLDVTRVRWYEAELWEPSQLRQCLEEVTDFVLLLDDDMCTLLREAKPDIATPDPAVGQELLVVLQQREAHAAAGLESAAARVWLALAATLQLIALKRIAGKPQWNFEQEDKQGRLHWFYDANEKVLMHSEALKNHKFVGADETRLGEKVKQFAEHTVPACPRCGAIHGMN